jgi:hypothetical protein
MMKKEENLTKEKGETINKEDVEVHQGEETEEEAEAKEEIKDLAL